MSTFLEPSSGEPFFPVNRSCPTCRLPFTKSEVTTTADPAPHSGIFILRTCVNGHAWKWVRQRVDSAGEGREGE